MSLASASASVLAGEAQRGQDRAEHLLAGDRHRVGDVAEHGRLDEEAVAEAVGAPAAGDQPRALGLRRGDPAGDVLQVLGERHRPHLGLGIERVAEADRLRPRGEQRRRTRRGRRPRRTGASPPCRSARRGEDARDDAVRRRLEIGVGEHDVGRLAAQLQRHPREVRRGAAHHRPARRRAARERHLVHARVLDQRRARLAAEAGDHIHDTRREAGLLEQLQRTPVSRPAPARPASPRPCSRRPAPARASTRRAAPASSTA